MSSVGDRIRTAGQAAVSDITLLPLDLAAHRDARRRTVLRLAMTVVVVVIGLAAIGLVRARTSDVTVGSASPDLEPTFTVRAAHQDILGQPLLGDHRLSALSATTPERAVTEFLSTLTGTTRVELGSTTPVTPTSATITASVGGEHVRVLCTYGPDGWQVERLGARAVAWSAFDHQAVLDIGAIPPAAATLELWWTELAGQTHHTVIATSLQNSDDVRVGTLAAAGGSVAGVLRDQTGAILDLFGQSG